MADEEKQLSEMTYGEIKAYLAQHHEDETLKARGLSEAQTAMQQQDGGGE